MSKKTAGISPPQPPATAGAGSGPDETNDYTAWAKGEERIRLIMFAVNARQWLLGGEGLYRAFLAHPEIEPLVLFAPQDLLCQPDHFAPLLVVDDLKRLLVDLDTPFISCAAYDLPTHRPHLAVLPYADEWRLPPAFSSSNLTGHGVRPVILRQDTDLSETAAAIYNECGAPAFLSAWKVLARSQSQWNTFGKYCPAGNQHVLVTGHPKLDPYNRPGPSAQDILQKAAGRPCLMLNLSLDGFRAGRPENAEGNPLSCQILRNLNQMTDYFFIVRPSYLYRTALSRQGWSRIQINEFKNELQAGGNVWWDESHDFFPAFRTAGALISDLSQVIIDFLPTRKPMLLLADERFAGVRGEFSELLPHLYLARNLPEFRSFAELAAGNLAGPQIPEQALNYWVQPSDGPAAARIAETLVQELGAGLSFALRPPWEPARPDDAESYWHQADNSLTDDPLFQEWKTLVVGRLLKQYGPFGRVLDLGCGQGHYTEILSAQAEWTEGWDISQKFIAAAQSAAKSRQLNISYQVGTDLDIITGHKYDLVACLEVTSSFIGNFNLGRLFDRLDLWLPAGGYFMLSDTFSVKYDHIPPLPPGQTPPHEHMFRYRGLEGCLNALQRRGYRLLERLQRPMGQEQKTYCDALMLWKRETI